MNLYIPFIVGESRGIAVFGVSCLDQLRCPKVQPAQLTKATEDSLFAQSAHLVARKKWVEDSYGNSYH